VPVNLVNFDQSTHYVNTVYADANFVWFIRDRLASKYTTAATILGNLIVQRIQIFISCLVIDELWYSLIRGWYRRFEGKRLSTQDIKTDPSILSRYSYHIGRNTLKVLKIPNLEILPRQQSPRGIIDQAMNIYASENLMPRDSFHLAYVMAHGIKGFITSDPDFDNLQLPTYDLTIYKY